MQRHRLAQIWCSYFRRSFVLQEPKKCRWHSLTAAHGQLSLKSHEKKSYRHLKALYLRGYIDGQPVNKMLVDTGAAVNIMPYSMLRRLGRSNADLIKTNVTLSDFNGQASEAQGVLNVDLTIGRKTIPTSLHRRQQKHLRCPAREGLDSRQLLHSIHNAPMPDTVGWR